jgi:hydroxypyruvate isomerase
MSERVNLNLVPGEFVGRYSNLFKTGFNAFEFLFEYGHDFAGAADACMHTRIITAPAYAKAFAQLLMAAIQDYELKHGPIPEQHE